MYFNAVLSLIMHHLSIHCTTMEKHEMENEENPDFNDEQEWVWNVIACVVSVEIKVWRLQTAEIPWDFPPWCNNHLLTVDEYSSCVFVCVSVWSYIQHDLKQNKVLICMRLWLLAVHFLPCFNLPQYWLTCFTDLRAAVQSRKEKKH